MGHAARGRRGLSGHTRLVTSVKTPARSRAQHAVSAALNDRSRVTQEQADFAVALGDLFLKACPGSGKTRTVGLRLAYNAAFRPDRAIAALSHTNTAERAIAEATNERVALPHHYFVGTLHAFLLAYVVYPFGHLYMRCPDTPQVLGHDRDWPADLPDTWVGAWKRCRVKPWRFDADAKRQMSYRRPLEWPRDLTADVVVAEKSVWARSAKRAYWELGLLSFSDVLYVAMRVLEEFEDIRTAVAARFDEILVDEVQDTNDVQLRCLQLLRRPALKPSLVAVGDVDQAVYEWGRARPDELLQAIAAEGMAEFGLSANFRSSQAVCAVTYRFSTRPTAERAMGEHAACPHPAEFWDADAEVALARFRKRLTTLGIREENSAVLVRTNAQVETLNDFKLREAWPPLLGLLGRAALARDTAGPSREDFDGLRRAVATVAFKTARPRGLDEAQRDRLHTATCDLLEALPPATGTVRAFNLTARDALAEAARSALDGAEPEGKARLLLKDDPKLERHDSGVAFAPPPAALARTIHDAKGTSIDAVLVIARPDDLGAWLDEVHVQPRPSVLREDTRLAYVALSRAQRVLILASPNASAEHVRLVRSIGFVVAA